ncbi:hypothetical protein ACHAXS_000313 [Conticribra weissflogii]
MAEKFHMDSSLSKATWSLASRWILLKSMSDYRRTYDQCPCHIHICKCCNT